MARDALESSKLQTNIEVKMNTAAGCVHLLVCCSCLVFIVVYELSVWFYPLVCVCLYQLICLLPIFACLSACHCFPCVRVCLYELSSGFAPFRIIFSTSLQEHHKRRHNRLPV